MPYAETVRVEVAPGHAYWSVLSGPALTAVEPVDSFLRHLRFGRRRAEGTTKTYAGHLKRFEQWRLSRGATWEDAARDLATYVIWLRINLRTSPGRGQGRAPSESALAPALAAIHGFYWHAVDVGDIDRGVLAALFEVGGTPPPHVGRRRVEGPRPRLRVDPRPSYPVNLGPPAATVEEFAALLGAARSARDACMVAFLGGLGLRVEQYLATGPEPRPGFGTCRVAVCPRMAEQKRTRLCGSHNRQWLDAGRPDLAAWAATADPVYTTIDEVPLSGLHPRTRLQVLLGYELQLRDGGRLSPSQVKSSVVWLRGHDVDGPMPTPAEPASNR